MVDRNPADFQMNREFRSIRRRAIVLLLIVSTERANTEQPTKNKIYQSDRLTFQYLYKQKYSHKNKHTIHRAPAYIFIP
jgi:hypothetical protein